MKLLAALIMGGKVRAVGAAPTDSAETALDDADSHARAGDADVVLYIGGPPNPDNECPATSQFGKALHETFTNASMDVDFDSDDCDCRQWAFQFLQPNPPTPPPTTIAPPEYDVITDPPPTSMSSDQYDSGYDEDDSEEEDDDEDDDHVYLDSKKPSHNKTSTPSWMFERAKNREDVRKEEHKSDWIFARANDRKKFHDLNAAEWHSRKSKNKVCSEDNEGDESCENIEKVK